MAFFISWLFSLNVSAQLTGQNRIDSLKAELPKVTTIKDKADILIRIARIYYKINPDKTLEYAGKSMALSEQIKWEEGIAKGNWTIGYAYGLKKMHDVAIPYYLDAARYYELKDEKKKVIDICLSIVYSYDNLYKYDEAIDYYEKLMKLYEQTNDKKGTAQINASMGIDYFHKSEYPKAISYYEKAIAQYKAIGDTLALANTCFNLATLHLSLNNYEQGLQLVDQAIAIYQKFGKEDFVNRCKGQMGTLYYQQGDYQRALQYFTEALQYYQTKKDTTQIAFFLGNTAMVYNNQGKHLKAIELGEQACKMLEASGAKREVASMLMNVGDDYCDLGNYPKALEYYLRSQRICDTFHLKRTEASLKISMGRLYRGQGQNDKAMQMFESAISTYNEMGERIGMYTGYLNVAELYLEQANYTRALENANKAHVVYQNLDDKHHLTYADFLLHDIYIAQLDFSNADRYNSDALKLAENIDVKYYLARGYVNKGYDLLQKAKAAGNTLQAGEYDKLVNEAIPYLQEGAEMQLANGALAVYSETAGKLAEGLAMQRDYESALNIYKDHVLYRDSTFNTEKLRDFTRKELDYIYALKQDSLRLENERRELLIQKEIQLSTLRYEYEKKQALAKSEQEKNMLQLEEALKIERIETGYSKKIAIAESEKLQRDAIARAAIKDAQLARLALSKKQNERTFYAAGFVLLLLVVGLLFLARKRREQKTAAEFKLRLADLEIAALRAQMNPHFIFNCLNSINSYILKNDALKASSYLTKFSKLIRFILDSSSASAITLDQELQMLRLFAEMEALRFSQRFSYIIQADEELHTESIFISPMLVQPYVENAIWHGLMHKKAQGHLKVYFHKQVGNMIQVVIQDDGVGRKEAKARKTQNATKDKSHGMRITGDRLRIAGEQLKADVSMQIEDMTDEQGVATGTRVTLKIPYTNNVVSLKSYSLS